MASGKNIGIELKSNYPIIVGSYKIDNYNVLNDTELKIGDRIITTGLQKVIPGQPVRIVEKTVESNKNVNRKEGIISKALKKLFRYFKNLGKKEI